MAAGMVDEYRPSPSIPVRDLVRERRQWALRMTRSKESKLSSTRCKGNGEKNSQLYYFAIVMIQVLISPTRELWAVLMPRTILCLIYARIAILKLFGMLLWPFHWRLTAKIT